MAKENLKDINIYKFFFDYANLGFAYIDRTGKILEVNNELLKIALMKKEKVLGKNFTQLGLFDKKNLTEILKTFKDVLAGKRKKNYNIVIKNKKGEEVFLEANYFFVKDGLKGIGVILRDVTEEKKMEEKLKYNEEWYRKRFEESMDAIFIADAKTGILIDCNKAAEKLVERNRSEIIGHHQTILHPPETVKGLFSETFKKHLKECEGQILETQVITKSGKRKDVAIKANLIKLGNKKFLHGIFRDITEEKKVKNELEKKVNELENTKKQLEEKIRDLERFERITVGRELKMIELKNRIRELEEEIKKLKGEK